MSRIEFLESEGEDCPYSLMQIIKSLGRNSGKKVVAVEGHDDVTFLQSTISMTNKNALDRIVFENLAGKGNVLEAHEAALDSLELPLDKLRFVVDRDFDDLRGLRSSENLWMTPTYSFENLLISKKVLKHLLAAEYRCTGEAGERDIEKVCEKFDAFIASYESEMRFANLVIFHCTKNRVRNNPHDETIGNKIQWDGDACRILLTTDEILMSIPKEAEVSTTEVEAVEAEFEALDPVMRWRGKFLLKLFVKFLADLRRDRGKKNPDIFEKKQAMQFNPELDPIRTLSSLFDPPECLSRFIEEF